MDAANIAWTGLVEYGTTKPSLDDSWQDYQKLAHVRIPNATFAGSTQSQALGGWTAVMVTAAQATTTLSTVLKVVFFSLSSFDQDCYKSQVAVKMMEPSPLGLSGIVDNGSIISPS